MNVTESWIAYLVLVGSLAGMFVVSMFVDISMMSPFGRAVVSVILWGYFSFFIVVSSAFLCSRIWVKHHDNEGRKGDEDS